MCLSFHYILVNQMGNTKNENSDGWRIRKINERNYKRAKSGYELCVDVNVIFFSLQRTKTATVGE